MAITVPGKAELLKEQSVNTAQKNMNLLKISALEAQNAQIDVQQAFIASTLEHMCSLTFLAPPADFVATITGPTSAALTWANDPNAETYVINQATQEDFSDAIQIYEGSRVESFNVSDLTTGVAAYWQIKSRAANRDDSDWSATSVTISA